MLTVQLHAVPGIVDNGDVGVGGHPFEGLDARDHAVVARVDDDFDRIETHAFEGSFHRRDVSQRILGDGRKAAS